MYPFISALPVSPVALFSMTLPTSLEENVDPLAVNVTPVPLVALGVRVVENVAPSVVIALSTKIASLTDLFL